MAQQGFPKAAAELLELASERGWKTGTAHGIDSADNPFVTIELGRVVGDSVFHYRITWHTRGTGTYRLFSKICRVPGAMYWHDAPSLRVIQTAIRAS